LIKILKALFNSLKELKDISIQILQNTLFNILSFVENFSERSQSYNDKHKNLLRQINNFINLYFKLFSESKEELTRISSWELLNVNINFIITLIEKFQTFTKSNESKIKQILVFYLNSCIIDNNLIFNNEERLKTCKLICFCYASLPRLTNDYNKSFNVLNNNILKEIKYLKQLCNTVTFKLKNIKDKEKNSVDNEKSNLFIYRIEENNPIRLCNAVNGFYILFKILKYSFQIIPLNTNIEFDFSSLLSLLCIFLE